MPGMFCQLCKSLLKMGECTNALCRLSKSYDSEYAKKHSELVEKLREDYNGTKLDKRQSRTKTPFNKTIRYGNITYHISRNSSEDKSYINFVNRWLSLYAAVRMTDLPTLLLENGALPRMPHIRLPYSHFESILLPEEYSYIKYSQVVRFQLSSRLGDIRKYEKLYDTFKH